MTAHPPNDWPKGPSLCYVAFMTTYILAGMAGWLMLAYSIH